MGSTLLLPVLFFGGAMFAVIVGLYKYFNRDKVVIAERVETYAGIEEEAAAEAAAQAHQQSPVSRLFGLLMGRGYTESIEQQLAQADVPMRVSEFILTRLVLAALGFLIGWGFLAFMHSGLILAIIGYLAPGIFVSVNLRRRREKFVRQLADALMLLTNSLRSGYGFLKGLELVAKEMDDPLSKEFNRVLREVNLGATVDDAMLNMGKRLKSEDLDIVISSYLVQKEVGGNLNEIMEKVAETIRERLRIQGDVRVLTAQGKLSGIIVGSLPFFVFLWLMITNPKYFQAMLGEPYFGTTPAWLPVMAGTPIPWGIVLALGAVVLQAFGVFMIYKIVTIRV